MLEGKSNVKRENHTLCNGGFGNITIQLIGVDWVPGGDFMSSKMNVSSLFLGLGIDVRIIVTYPSSWRA